MRDVSDKPNTLRTATAAATLRCLPATIVALRSGNVPKADPLGVAKVAGIQAAKHTSLIIPYCHPVPLDYVNVEIEVLESSLEVRSEVKAVWKTGVEMEALAAASAAALTLYDMLKIIDQEMEIASVRLSGKTGGKSDSPSREGSTLKAAVLVLSDLGSRGEREDRSGVAIEERLASHGVHVIERAILPDDLARIQEELRRLCDVTRVDLVITTGGTGIGQRDVTPEATARVVERTLPGVSEFLRAHGQERTRYSMLSRGIAGVRGRTLIVNLPGSPNAVRESMDVLLPWIFHSFAMIDGKGH